MIYGKNTLESQQKTIHISQITQNQLFPKISFYFYQISKIFQTMSLIVRLNRLNYYIRYAHTRILIKIQEMVAASTFVVEVPLSKTDFAHLNAPRQALESIHTQMFKQKKTKIS